MRIKIAIILICWLVLFASAYAIDEQSVNNVLNRNSLSIGIVSDFVQEIIPQDEAAANDETSGDNAESEVQGNDGVSGSAGISINYSINGAEYVDSNNSTGQEKEHRNLYNGTVIPLPE